LLDDEWLDGCKTIACATVKLTQRLGVQGGHSVSDCPTWEMSIGWNPSAMAGEEAIIALQHVASTISMTNRHHNNERVVVVLGVQELRIGNNRVEIFARRSFHGETRRTGVKS
jgi:hypothetical protein